MTHDDHCRPSGVFMLLLLCCAFSAGRTVALSPQAGSLSGRIGRLPNPVAWRGPTGVVRARGRRLRGEAAAADGARDDQATESEVLTRARPLSEVDVKRLSPVTLAYVGDAVIELYLRERLLWPPRRPAELRARVVEIVRAETQAAAVRQLLVAVDAAADATGGGARRGANLRPPSKEQRANFVLNEREREWLRRGRNATKGRGPSRLGGGSEYQDASGLECLIGYLHLTGSPRLAPLLAELLRLAPPEQGSPTPWS